MVRMVKSSGFEIFLAVVDTEPINPVSPLKLDLVDEQSLQGNHNVGQLVLPVVIDKKSIVPENKETGLHDQSFLSYFHQLALFHNLGIFWYNAVYVNWNFRFDEGDATFVAILTRSLLMIFDFRCLHDVCKAIIAPHIYTFDLGS